MAIKYKPPGSSSLKDVKKVVFNNDDVKKIIKDSITV
jgi:hypothetical protein